ncbi:MAG: acyl-CoA desaturase [Bacteroidota bacterium]|nr:acyl-CoA desaturase [Bacteroidota bacterium]
MVFKTIFMLSLFFVPFIFILINPFPYWWFSILMWSLMGLGMAGIGLSVMHDANHGAYSKNPKINKALGYCLNLIGGYDLNWRIQHNVLHHTYTNIIGMDEDVDAGIVLRFSDSQPRKWHHGYQHLYAWFLYGLMTISWILTKDFIQIIKYNKKNLVQLQGYSLYKAVFFLSLWKTFYMLYIIGLPILINGNVGVTIAGFLLMHFIAGFFLTTVFLCAHIVDQTDFPLPEKNGEIQKNWYIHQMETTANFSNRKSFFSWFIGGLNYQIEHHLFPNICHIHYYQLSKIVKSTAEEFNVPYHANNSFLKALKHHATHLKQMGSKPST